MIAVILKHIVRIKRSHALRPLFTVFPANAETHLLVHPEMGPRVRGDDSLRHGRPTTQIRRRL